MYVWGRGSQNLLEPPLVWLFQITLLFKEPMRTKIHFKMLQNAWRHWFNLYMYYCIWQKFQVDYAGEQFVTSFVQLNSGGIDLNKVTLYTKVPKCKWCMWACIVLYCCCWRPTWYSFWYTYWKHYGVDTAIVIQLMKTWHIDAFLEIQIFASASSICQTLCSVVIRIML